MYLVLTGVNNVISQQEKITLKVTNHRLVFEYPAQTSPSPLAGYCAGKFADFVPFWYMSAIEPICVSKNKALLQFSLRDSCSFTLLLPNITEAKAITQVRSCVHPFWPFSLFFRNRNRDHLSLRLRSCPKRSTSLIFTLRVQTLQVMAGP